MSKKKRKNRHHINTGAPNPNQKLTKEEQAEALVREGKSLADEPLILEAAGRTWELHPASKLPAVKTSLIVDRMTSKDPETGLTFYEENPVKMIIDLAEVIGFLCKHPEDRKQVLLLNTEQFQELMTEMLGTEIIDASKLN